MAKGLILTLPLQGHMAPLLPLVGELASRGDDLTVYATPTFAARTEATGARYRPYRASILDDLTHLPEKTEEISSLLMGIVRKVLDDDLADMRGVRPDYVVTDSVAPWGQWVARLLDVPVATSITTVAVNRHVLRFAASRGVRPKGIAPVLSKLRHVMRAVGLRRKLARQHGVDGPGILGTVFGHSALNIVHTSRDVQPCGDTFDDSYHFVGPPTDPSRTVHAGDPDGNIVAALAGDDVPIVYVSLGTLFNADASFYRACFEAFRDEPVRVVMSIGSRVQAVDLGTPPANTTVAATVPQLDVLARASAFVTHGGMNSVNESLGLGVPMVTVPQMGEQDIVSRRIEQLGAGLYVSKAEVSPERLRTSVRRLLAQGTFRANAVRLGETLRAAGGTGRAASVIQSFVQTPARRV